MECIDVIKKIRNLEALKREQYNAIEKPQIKKTTKTVLKDSLVNYKL
jgi:hypothetical protein